jgi:hypothetical protein
MLKRKTKIETTKFAHNRLSSLSKIKDEFLDALKEEEQGLQKIIEAYDKRIDQSR